MSIKLLYLDICRFYSPLIGFLHNILVGMAAPYSMYIPFLMLIRFNLKGNLRPVLL